jgi:hypothetical protein
MQIEIKSHKNREQLINYLSKQFRLNCKKQINLIIMSIIIAAFSSVAYADLYLNSKTGYINLNTTGETRLQITPGGNLDLLGIVNVSISGNLSVSGNISVDGSTLFVDSHDNRVGIGTTGPEALLHIDGSRALFNAIYIGENRTGSIVGQAIEAIGGNSIILASGSGGNISFGSDINTEVMRINNNGNVGIGTANPTSPLAVNGSIYIANSSAGNLRLEWDDTNNISRIRAAKDGSVETQISFWTQTPAGSFAERVRIDGNGKVGIGTESPKAALNVVGDVYYNLSAKSQDFNIVNGSGSSRFFINNSIGVVGIGDTTIGDFNEKLKVEHNISSDLDDTNNGTIAIFSSAPDLGNRFLEIGTRPTGTSNYALSLQSYHSQDTNTYFLLLNPDGGNVGIGTTAPSELLDVVGNVEITGGAGNDLIFIGDSDVSTQGDFTVDIDSDANSAGNAFKITHDGGTELFRVQENGNVGIGTTSPNQLLEVNGASNPRILINATGSNHAGLILRTDVSTHEIFATNGGSYGAGKLVIYDTNASAERILIDSDGNVGIGTTAPVTKLQVQGIIRSGNVASPRYRVDIQHDGTDGVINSYDDTGATYSPLYMDGSKVILNSASAGNVGIGTTTPSEKLTISGNLSVSGNCKDGGASTTCDITADIAEAFNVSQSKKQVEAGDVLVIDSSSDKFDKGAILSNKPYDDNVLGVVSSAPTIIMGRLNGGIPVALTGVVPVKVTTENGPIAKGDLLTTSKTLGHAMKCNERIKCTGSILAKSLESFNGDNGKIMALVTLQ